LPVPVQQVHRRCTSSPEALGGGEFLGLPTAPSGVYRGRAFGLTRGGRTRRLSRSLRNRSLSRR
jgi:hypothetical protein